MVDCDLIGGLPIPDALHIISVEDPETTVWIGCRTGFVIIGTAEELRKQLHKVTIDNLITLEKRLHSAFRAVIDHTNSLGGWQETKTGKKLINEMTAADNDLRSFVPFEERSVKKSYRKISGDIVIILEGFEKTKIFTREEYEEHYAS